MDRAAKVGQVGPHDKFCREVVLSPILSCILPLVFYISSRDLFLFHSIKLFDLKVHSSIILLLE